MAFQSLLSSRHQKNDSPVDYTPASAVTGGAFIAAGGSVQGWADRDIAASEKGAMHFSGIRRLKKSGSSGPVFAVGDEVWYDASASLHVVRSASPADADYPVGICIEAAVTGQDYVLTYCYKPMDPYSVLRPYIQTFDWEDTADHTIIPAWMNRHGLIYKNAFALVVEASVGTTEDQLVVTIEDEDDTAICTITTKNTTPEAAGDIVLANIGLYQDDSGDVGDTAWKTVAAGKEVHGVVSQATAGGTPAGTLKVFTEWAPLV